MAEEMGPPAHIVFLPDPCMGEKHLPSLPAAVPGLPASCRSPPGPTPLCLLGVHCPDPAYALQSGFRSLCMS